MSIAAFPVIFARFIVADIWIPLTPDSTVMRVVTPVSSRVSGYVSQVHVQIIAGEEGDLLYELDPTPFINKVEAAQIARPEQAKLSNQQLDAQIASARANLRTARNSTPATIRPPSTAISAWRHAERVAIRSRQGAYRRQTSEQSVAALNASIQNLLIQRGERDDKRNVTLQNTVTRWKRRS